MSEMRPTDQRPVLTSGLTAEISRRVAEKMDPHSRDNFLRRVGPHLAVTEFRLVELDGGPGIGMVRHRVADTACGKTDIFNTLCSPHREVVRCPDCLAAESAAATEQSQ
jgi:hypothetical protein